jgi:predicted ATPase with chaperone activity
VRRTPSLWWPATVNVSCSVCFAVLGHWQLSEVAALGRNPIRCESCGAVNVMPSDLLRHASGVQARPDPDNPPGRAEAFDAIVGNILLRRALVICVAGHHTLAVVGRADDNWPQVQAIMGARAVRVQRCPCGGYLTRECFCGLDAIEAHKKTSLYREALASDVIVETYTPGPEEFWADFEPYANIVPRLQRFRLLQQFDGLAHFAYSKKTDGGRFIVRDETFEILNAARKKYEWGTDSLKRVQRVARTIATLAEAPVVDVAHMQEAITFRLPLVEDKE